MLVIPPPRDSGFTTTTSVPLYWCAYGRPGARRLLVLHGGPGADHRYLLPQLLELGDEHELVFYDQRGGGQSRTDDPAPITWQTHVEDFDAIARELGLVTREIVGYSWGGLLAMLYALTSADAVPGSLSPVPRDSDSRFPIPWSSLTLLRSPARIASSSRRSSRDDNRVPLFKRFARSWPHRDSASATPTSIGSGRSSSASPGISPTRRARATSRHSALSAASSRASGPASGTSTSRKRSVVSGFRRWSYMDDRIPSRGRRRNRRRKRCERSSSSWTTADMCPMWSKHRLYSTPCANS